MADYLHMRRRSIAITCLALAGIALVSSQASAGVLPEDFEMPLESADILIPAQLRPLDPKFPFASRIVALGRLKQDVTPERAARALEPQLEAMSDGIPPSFRVAWRVQPLRDRRVGDAARTGSLLVSAVTTLLLIAGVNVTNLLLARSVGRRGEVKRTPAGVTVIDDSYNASPAAVRAMLAALRSTPAAGRRLAVLGEMLELGDRARDLHADAGSAAAAAGVDTLVVVGGPAADGLVDGAVAAGFPAAEIHRFADSGSACAPVAALVREGDLILVKGSRGTRTGAVMSTVEFNGSSILCGGSMAATTSRIFCSRSTGGITTVEPTASGARSVGGGGS